MGEPSEAAAIRGSCPRWLSARCRGGFDCDCLPPSQWALAASGYRAVQGWPVHVTDTVVWLGVGAEVEALNVSRAVGERVVRLLDAKGVRLPAINVPPDRWSLLMQPYRGAKADVAKLLSGKALGEEIGYAYTGRWQGRTSDWIIELPPTQHGRLDPLSWVTAVDIPLPAAAMVLDAVVRALAR
jgi:hypothetical protein